MRSRLMHACITVAALAAIAATATPASAHSTQAKLQQYRKIENRHENTLRFFANRPWMTVPSKAKCWQATGWHRRKVCRIARREVATAKARLANVREQIEKLEGISGPLGNTGAWNCIHGYEDAGLGWGVNTGNGYFGGLQMDRSFMGSHGADVVRRYGGYIDGDGRAQGGEAHLWTAAEQIMVAQRAHDGWYTTSTGKLYRGSARGYYPWPNTARYCGLI